MENIIILMVMLAIVGGIVAYLRNAKKRGKKCIGCPYAEKCNKNCGG